MKEERLKILQMIEDGKITAAEGVELLSVLKGSESAKEKFDKAAKKTGEFVCNAKEKVCGFAKEKEPAVKEAVENIAEIAGEIADGVGKTIKNFVDGNDIVKNEEENDDDVEEEKEDEENIIDI